MNKIRLVMLLWMWVFVSIICFYMIGIFESTFFRFGPTDTFFFMGAPIDKWWKWICLILFRIIGTTVEVAATDIVYPWIVTQLQDEERRILPYPLWKCKMIVQLYFLYWNLQAIFAVFLALSQFDMAISVVVTQVVVVQSWTLPNWFKNKEFIEEKEVGEELLKQVSIE